MSLDLKTIVGDIFNIEKPNFRLQDIVGNIFHTEENQTEADANKVSDTVQTMNNVFGKTTDITKSPYAKTMTTLEPMSKGLLDVQIAKAEVPQSTSNSLEKISAGRKQPIFSFTTPQKTTSSTSNGAYRVGSISAKYEAGGFNGGIVSTGADYGGISYGIPQFSTKAGSADAFANWLKQNKPEIGNYFGNYKAGTAEFTNAWKKAYADFGDEFSYIQMEYAYDNIALPLANLAKEKTGIDYTRSPALKELVYTTALQFGPGSLGLSALGNVTADMSDTDIINASFDKKIANYKSYFKSSSPQIQEAAKVRFGKERNDILGLVNQYGSNAYSGGNFVDMVGTRVANTANYNNSAAKGQCVWYVRGRANEKLGKDTGAIGNANEMWYNAKEDAKLSATSNNIKPNSIISYKYGSGNLGQKYGHVIFIEDVVGDTVYYTEGGSGYYKNGTDGVVKTATKEQILQGVNSSGSRIGSNVIGIIDLSKY